ncbi:hypothetical protein A0O32_2480 [Anoxybacillus flavithermus]|uniref:hypothetical protein n=1 Tax=Anoxybacillus flavithermus TaxID=33934 RepID=UPI0007D9C7C1|nr:hypothetical protein [Anoxybacillus flavithermus]OAO77615.1 hypothetical protein A0O32_2480 [Anoxybacillus flavithermus]
MSVSEHMKNFLEEYPAMLKEGKWCSGDQWYDIEDMSPKWIRNVINYLEQTVKPAYAFNERSEEEKKIAEIINAKIAEFKSYL